MEVVMERRGFFKSLAAFAGLAASGAVVSSAKAAPSVPDKHKVAYHLTEAERAKGVLGNIRNHIQGVGGPENVDIVLVVHGAAVKAFEDISVHPDLKDSFVKLKSDGVSFAACGNTLKSLKWEVSDLVPGFVRVDQGGVVRLAELQSQGYVYLRP
jgi:intracellular sulfur oxidation DsrE/DsrF family protein